MGQTLKVAVLLGGRSPEREISLLSGEAVYQALLQLGCTAWKIDVRENLVTQLEQRRPDVVFIALHGVYGEDGTVQGLLETLDLPYTGSGVLASAIAMNKIVTKRLLVQAGLRTAAFVVLDRQAVAACSAGELAVQALRRFGGRAVFKVPHQGSSIGIYPVDSEKEAVGALELCLDKSSEVLVEEYLPGMEVTAPVLGNEQPRVLPLIEIVPANQSHDYDYEAKYAPGGSRHLIPPNLEVAVQQEITSLALSTYRLLGCAGLARIDFRLDANGAPSILEVNTIPGLTATSLVPDSARAAGIEFPDLIAEVVRLALQKSRGEA